MPVLLVCYLTGMVGLVALLDVVRHFWYRLLYHMDSGMPISFLEGEINLVPDFFHHLGSETVANLAMFTPFGILYPLSQERPSWKKTMLAGIICTVAIELLQPIFGRAFDINDIIMNTMGVMVSASLLFLLRRLAKEAEV